MNITIAIDSLKGSLTSLEAGQAVADGIRKVYPDSRIHIRPLADGGEGTVEALTYGMDGNLQYADVTGPLGARVTAAYGILKDGRTAIIEMASAAGITLTTEAERNPLYTTTYGVGELIRDAIQKGCRRFLVGIGGSATNDGGAGMLQALGFEMLNERNEPIGFGSQGLSGLHTITDTHVLPELKDCSFRIACDVTNPLCGANGCSAVYGPQKGATDDMIQQMDQWLASYAGLTGKLFPNADPDKPGAGAAGGLGFAFFTFLNATLESGVKIVLEETRLEDYIKNSDIVITGEGRLDGQTVMGKAPIGVAEIAKKFQKPVIAFSGSVTRDAVVCNNKGIDAFFPILRGITTLDEALQPEIAGQNMSETVEQVFRLIQTFSQA